MDSIEPTTQALLDLRRGHREAIDRLVPRVYEELREIASDQLRRERRNHTLQATALAHEAYLRLIDQERVDWRDRSHFLAVAAEMVRRILIDHARAKVAEKRGGRLERVAIEELAEKDEIEDRPDLDAAELVALDEALIALKELDERQARVVELRWFGGLSIEEAALVLDVSPRTVNGDWKVARAWLRERLGR